MWTSIDQADRHRRGEPPLGDASIGDSLTPTSCSTWSQPGNDRHHDDGDPDQQGHVFSQPISATEDRGHDIDPDMRPTADRRRRADEHHPGEQADDSSSPQVSGSPNT